MANSSVLREFLIKLGFKVDPASFKKFNEGVEVSTKTALGISAAVAGASFALEKYVSNMAQQLEKLYYSSQRAGTTVGNLQALRFGAEQIGLTADQVTGALEGMARQLRTNPGLYGLLQSLGVKVTGRDKADVMTDLVTQLRKLPFYQGSAVANLFGIDPDTLLMLERGLEDMQKARAQQKGLLGAAGLSEQDAKDAKDFSNNMRQLSAVVGVLAQQMEKDLLPAANAIIGVLKVATGWLIQADVATDGWSNRIGALFGTLVAIAGLKGALSWLPKLLGGGTAAAGAGASAGAAGAIAARGLTLLGAGGLIGGAAYGMLRAIAARQQAEADYRMQVEGYLNDQQRKKAAPGGTAPIGVRQNNPGNLREWAGQSTQGGFAVFGSVFEGMAAMAQNLLTYAKRGWNTVGSIISHWAPASENDTASYIKDVAAQLGIRADQQIDFKDHTVLRNLMAAMIHHEQGSDPYSLALIDQAAQYRLGAGPATGAGVQVQQHNQITVHGSNDPDRTARVVGEEQRRVNGDLARNLGTVSR